MAIIPLRQKITVYKSGGIDEWGYEVPGETIEMNARVDEITEVVTNFAGEEAVTGVQVTLNKMAGIHYNDEISYTDELGRNIKRKPVKIEPIRGINGKAILTVVYL